MELLYDILDFPAVKWLFLVLALVMPLASLLTWAERRQSAMMQDRLGPNRANIGPIRLKGILHFVADALKMISKEDFVPANVHKGLFALAPILALAPVLIAFAIIPFGPTIYPHNFTEQLNHYDLAANPALPQFADGIRMQIWQVDFGLIFYFAILTLANYGGTIAGWASYNKWALLGGLRSSSQMMSYEVAMGLALMGAFLVAGSLEPGTIVANGATAKMSPANPANWLWLWQPLGLILFFTAAIAETKRAPFDIPEGEPEIIGYFVEYSGMRWGMFFLAEFIEIVFISAVITSVFLGGYHFPFLDPDGFRIGGEMTAVMGADGVERFVNLGGSVALLPHWAVSLIQFATFGAKVVLLCWFQLMIRWTLPRFRADQLMNLGWKLLLPLALANVMVTALIWLFFL
jgi:NADH-quinone oxidoreductase subunit H